MIKNDCHIPGKEKNVADSHSTLVTAWHLWLSRDSIGDYKSFHQQKPIKLANFHKITVYTSSYDSTILVSTVSLFIMSKNRKTHGVICVFILLFVLVKVVNV